MYRYILGKPLYFLVKIKRAASLPRTAAAAAGAGADEPPPPDGRRRPSTGSVGRVRTVSVWRSTGTLRARV